MKKIMDFTRLIAMKGTMAYMSLPTILKVISIPILIVLSLLLGIWCWILFIPYVIKYGKNAWEVQLREQTEWVYNYWNI